MPGDIPNIIVSDKRFNVGIHIIAREADNKVLGTGSPCQRTRRGERV